jgi:hypothetical protein
LGIFEASLHQKLPTLTNPQSPIPNPQSLILPLRNQ